LVGEISQSANQFLQAQAPWAKLKSEAESAHAVLSDAAEVTYLLAGLLWPVVPRLAEKLFQQLNAPALTFAMISTSKYPLFDRNGPIGTPAPLVARLEEAQVTAILQPPDAGSKRAPEPAQSSTAATREIEHAEFAKLALKVGKVLTAERVPKADKLLKLSVD